MSRQEVQSNGNLRVLDGFSRQVNTVTHARRIDSAYAVAVGEIAAISLVGSDTRALDKIAKKLGRILSPDSRLQTSDQMKARLLGSLLTVKYASELIKGERKNGRSLRETSANERISTGPHIRNRRDNDLRTALHTAVEDVLTEKQMGDMVAVATLSAKAVATADQSNIAMASTQLHWLQHEARTLSESDEGFAVVACMTEGILDIVNPVLQKTQVLFAA